MRRMSDNALIATLFGIGFALLLVAAPLLAVFTIRAATAGYVVFLGYALATLVVLGVLLRRAGRDGTLQSWARVLLVPVLVALLYFSTPAIAWVGVRGFSYARFALMYPVYSRVVGTLPSAVAVEKRGEIGFVDYRLDPGPPVRVVFPHFGGLIDSWAGTIYDPSDEVAKAAGFRLDGALPELMAPLPVRKLFGGDLVACSRLAGHFFLCVFS